MVNVIIQEREEVKLTQAIKDGMRTLLKGSVNAETGDVVTLATEKRQMEDGTTCEVLVVLSRRSVPENELYKAIKQGRVQQVIGDDGDSNKEQ